MILNEEKPTKCFYIQEQQKQPKKTISKLNVKEKDETIKLTETKDTLQTIHKFFTNVDTKKQTDDELQEEFLQYIRTKLDEQAKHNLDLPITQDELSSTINNTDTNKSPGIDGLPIEFY